MYSLGDPKAEVSMLLEFLKSSKTGMPELVNTDWQEMSLQEKEQYFVVLRMALEHCKKNPDISEEGLTELYNQYVEAFSELVNTDSLLRKAVLRGTHSFFMADRKEVVDYFRNLVRQPTEANEM